MRDEEPSPEAADSRASPARMTWESEHLGGLAREPRVEIRLRSTAMGYVRAKRAMH